MDVSNDQQGQETGVILVYCTCPDGVIARAMAGTLVREGHTPCVHILPAGHSVYRWQGQIEETSEITLLIKAQARTYPALEARIRELHPYEVPEVIAVPITAGLPDYLNWIREQAV